MRINIWKSGLLALAAVMLIAACKPKQRTIADGYYITKNANYERFKLVRTIGDTIRFYTYGNGAIKNFQQYLYRIDGKTLKMTGVGETKGKTRMLYVETDTCFFVNGQQFLPINGASTKLQDGLYVSKDWMPRNRLEIRVKGDTLHWRFMYYYEPKITIDFVYQIKGNLIHVESDTREPDTAFFQHTAEGFLMGEATYLRIGD